MIKVSLPEWWDVSLPQDFRLIDFAYYTLYNLKMCDIRFNDDFFEVTLWIVLRNLNGGAVTVVYFYQKEIHHII